jgi:hypothetical protein
MIKTAKLALFLMFLPGCSTVSYKTSIAPDNDFCLVYVFRDDFVLLYSNYIKVAGVTYGQLLDNSYTKFNLAVGEKEINIRWFPLSGGVDLDVNIECLANKTHYVTTGGTFRYDGLSVPGTSPTSVQLMGTRRIVAREITKEEAEKRIQTYSHKVKN